MSLTQEQQTFIEECELEFADRYTNKDPDYKKVYDKGIPDPPIMCPWYMRSRNNYRDRAGGSQPYNDHRNNQDWEQQGYGRNRTHNNRYARRDRPY
ncbi:uncharacterized protein LOC126745962 [Anthonomus grandis grandis]|uniref:uncharacterized protein LOC126745962 n=1 Tax=Anthonomus grandis grandis TaxID=2921223 RepID=UPI00216534C7|nr:uncharacterized protein LOC126745962 [Anthonomus grandis grandis]